MREKVFSPLDGHCWSRDWSSGRGLTQIYNKGCIFSLYKSLFDGNYVFHVITETLQSSGPPTVTFGLIYQAKFTNWAGPIAAVRCHAGAMV